MKFAKIMIRISKISGGLTISYNPSNNQTKKYQEIKDFLNLKQYDESVDIILGVIKESVDTVSKLLQ